MGRIAAVGPDERVPRPDDARDFDFPAATALPGLIDNHVHVTLPPTVDPLATLASETDEQLVARGAVAAERMVRAGVTTAVDLGARGTTGFRVREVIERGISIGPRLLVAGRPVTPTRGHCHFFGGEADGVDGVRAAIRGLIEDEGADIIKMIATGGGLTAGTDSREAAYDTEVLRAAADETHRLGRRITTHAHGVPGIRQRDGGGHRLDPALHDARTELGVDVRRGRRAAHGRAGDAGDPDDLGRHALRGRGRGRHQQAPAEPGRDDPGRLVGECAPASTRRASRSCPAPTSG